MTRDHREEMRDRRDEARREDRERRSRAALPGGGADNVDGAREERVVVVKAVTPSERRMRDPFAEVTALAKTAGVEVVRRIPQNLDRPYGATYLGPGKLEEVAQAAGDLDVDAVIADNDLSPAQERNLEKAAGRKVIDRSQLILDIFAQRARTREAKLQVELAQLRYTLPRLKRMWGHLSRYEGGIGMRGPGETQLETDKRIAKKRIGRLEKEIEEIHRRTEASLQSRSGDFQVAIVGYTNAGKSTLLNRLTGSNELVEDKLFATLEGRTRRWQIAANRHVLVSDTVGFIRNLPHHLVASFRATLEEIRYADLIFHVVDASNPEAEAQVATVDSVLRDLHCEGKPTWALLNKWDEVPAEGLIEARYLKSLFAAGVRTFEISARSGAGIDGLREAVDLHLDATSVRVQAIFPHRRGDLVAYIRENGKVLLQEYTNEGVRVEADLSPARAAKLRGMWPDAVLHPPETGTVPLRNEDSPPL
jgi:GTPase